MNGYANLKIILVGSCSEKMDKGTVGSLHSFQNVNIKSNPMHLPGGGGVLLEQVIFWILSGLGKGGFSGRCTHPKKTHGPS